MLSESQVLQQGVRHRGTCLSTGRVSSVRPAGLPEFAASGHRPCLSPLRHPQRHYTQSASPLILLPPVLNHHQPLGHPFVGNAGALQLAAPGMQLPANWGTT